MRRLLASIPRHVFALLAVLSGITAVHAATGVNPTGVNVSATAPTTVFLTFQGLTAAENSAESFWCGELTASGLPIVTATNPCRPDTIFGFLPQRSDLSRISGTGGLTNLTDIMTIPTSVVRRAYQAAQRGDDATFFYVRHFVDGGAHTYVRVTCRMAGGGARVPLSLTNVRLGFQGSGRELAVIYLTAAEPLPAFGAQIRYNGSGQLRGRWEVVLPGDAEPEAFDLLPEPSLPIENRGSQKRYTLLDRFSVFLPPTGSVFLPGPDPASIPRNANGSYKILLRIETSDDREGNSNTGAGVVSSGGVAGFALPVLRFIQIGGDKSSDAPGTIVLLAPGPDAQLTIGRLPAFEWADAPGVRLYRLEIRDGGATPFVAIVKSGITRYAPPPFLGAAAPKGGAQSWRVLGLGADGREITSSGWRSFRLNNP